MFNKSKSFYKKFIKRPASYIKSKLSIKVKELQSLAILNDTCESIISNAKK